MRKKKQPRQRGFYGSWGTDGPTGDGGGGAGDLEMQRLLRDALYRHPGNLAKAIRVVEIQLKANAAGGKQSNAKDLAERMRGALDLLGDQLLPADQPKGEE